MFTEIVHAFVLEPHAIEHPLCSLHHTGIVITLSGMQGGTFHNDASNTVEGHKISKLQPIAKGARGCHHRVFQCQRT